MGGLPPRTQDCCQVLWGLLDGIRSLAAGLRTSVHAIHPHDDEYHYTIRGQVRERPKGITLKDLPPKDDLEGVAEVPISRAPS